MLLSKERADCQVMCATVSRGAWVRKKGTLPCNLRLAPPSRGYLGDKATSSKYLYFSNRDPS